VAADVDFDLTNDPIPEAVRRTEAMIAKAADLLQDASATPVQLASAADEVRRSSDLRVVSAATKQANDQLADQLEAKAMAKFRGNVRNARRQGNV